MSVERQFTPAGLRYARRGVELVTDETPILLDNDLIAVDDPAAWELFCEDKTGAHRHVWVHKISGWLSQTLTLPAWVARAPEKAREWLTGGVS